MFRGAYRGGAARFFALFRIVLLLFMGAAGGVLVTGCTTSGSPTLDMNGVSLGAGFSGRPTVAFEWMDGAPNSFLDRLKIQVAQEANARQVASVSVTQPSQYRVEIYVAATVQGQRTTIRWTWDVSTADHQRVARLAGEVPGAPSERAWGAADDAVAARIAQDGMSQLAALLSTNAAMASLSPATAPLGFLPSSRP